MSGRSGGGSRVALRRALAPLVVSVGCAQASAPPGGEPDRTPPQVVVTSPEPLAVVPDWHEPVVFRFDERISEQGLREAVLVSPAEVAFEVDKGRSELRVKPVGGWPRDRIIQIELRPEISDLFRNKRRETVRLVFSTGPAIPETALAGTAFDRLTGRPVPDARVEALLAAGPATYVAMTDTAGTFAFANLPAGDYQLTAYLDRNRSRDADFQEPTDRTRVTLSATDTTLLELRLLPGDTTPARIVRAEAIDSLHVRVVFDDAIDPALPLEGVRARILMLPDSQSVAVAEVLHAHAYERRASPRAAATDTSAVADPVVGDAAAADTAIVAPDTAAAAAAPAQEPLPARELVLVSARPLPPETELLVEVEGLTNLHGLTGGGGTSTFTTPARAEPPPAAPPDTTGSRRGR